MNLERFGYSKTLCNWEGLFVKWTCNARADLMRARLLYNCSFLILINSDLPKKWSINILGNHNLFSPVVSWKNEHFLFLSKQILRTFGNLSFVEIPASPARLVHLWFGKALKLVIPGCLQLLRQHKNGWEIVLDNQGNTHAWSQCVTRWISAFWVQEHMLLKTLRCRVRRFNIPKQTCRLSL